MDHPLPLPRQPVFIEPMECLAVAKLPDGQQWLYEIKLDGFRAEAVKSEGDLTLYSRRRKSFNRGCVGCQPIEEAIFCPSVEKEYRRSLSKTK